MKDSAAAIRAIVNCVREHPPAKAQSPEPETRLSGTGFFVAPNRVVTNNHVVSGCTKDIQVLYPNRGDIQQQYLVKTLQMIWFCCIPIWTMFRQPPSALGHELATRWPAMAFPTQASCPPTVTVRWDMLRP